MTPVRSQKNKAASRIWLKPPPSVWIKKRLAHLAITRHELGADDHHVCAVLPVHWHGVEGKVAAVVQALGAGAAAPAFGVVGHEFSP